MSTLFPDVPGFLTFCILFNFLTGSYVIDPISNPIRGRVIATDLEILGSSLSLAKNYCLGPYANGTFIACATLPELSLRVI